ncbi:NADH dehydrogenase [ubiquinone] 1 subunit C1, mitochondrial isoform X1 [Muntiacus reevesi]|uniref:NADH dehydrogenase [ubiquinone] 1 subunit C1, mitochondrial isoform X1 n=1 Tax=Muntiacus reevesi TaxID=9886 RepID=UPI003307B845
MTFFPHLLCPGACWETWGQSGPRRPQGSRQAPPILLVSRLGGAGKALGRVTGCGSDRLSIASPLLIARLAFHSLASSRSKFYIREPAHGSPNWPKVGLTLGTSVFLWIYLIKQHNEDVLEYKRRNGLE